MFKKGSSLEGKYMDFKDKTFILAILFFTTSCSPPPAPTPTATPIHTPLPTATPFPSLTPTTTPEPVFPLGELIHFQRDEQFKYDWFLYIPAKIKREQKTQIFLTGIHGNIGSPNYEDIVVESEWLAQGRIGWADNLDSILFIPVIPKYYAYQPYDFDLTSFDEGIDPHYQRPDVGINEIIDFLLGKFKSNGYNINSKIIIEGFSSGGMFAQRYTLIHPERVQAVAAGHCGGTFILPEEYFDDEPINWPVGINNYESLVGKIFNREAYKEVKQFIYIGTEDLNTTLILNNSITLWESQSQIDFVHRNFGLTSFEIIKNQIEYLHNLGYKNIIFKGYEGYGHEYPGVMSKDATDFLIENK